jgi:hypothetical protein
MPFSCDGTAGPWDVGLWAAGEAATFRAIAGVAIKFSIINPPQVAKRANRVWCFTLDGSLAGMRSAKATSFPFLK